MKKVLQICCYITFIIATILVYSYFSQFFINYYRMKFYSKKNNLIYVGNSIIFFAKIMLHVMHDI